MKGKTEMKIFQGKYSCFYTILSFIMTLLIVNMWCAFMEPNDAAIVSVYCGLVTALILCMKTFDASKVEKARKSYKNCRIIAWGVIVVMILVMVFAIVYGSVFNGIAYKIIRSAGFVATIGTYLIQWNQG